MSQCDISDTIEDIYGFDISHETISIITDCAIETANEWQNRPPKKFDSFLFVDCQGHRNKKLCDIRILGYDVNGIKDIPGEWIGNSGDRY